MSPSPSFNSYSNSNLAEIAARVVQEFRVEDIGRDHVLFPANYFGDFYCDQDIDSGSANDFEFAWMENSEGISADEIFHNGKILPLYPTHDHLHSNKSSTPLMNSGITTPLLAEERRQDVDELDGVPAETYCVWRPKATAAAEEKRNSFPKKWKLKDFLQRSFSVGSKDSIVFSSPNNRDIIRSKEEEEKEEETIKKSPVGLRNYGRKEGLVSFLSPSNINGGRKYASNNGYKWPPAAAAKPTPPPYNRDSGEKRRSYLPYRQQQVGFLANFMNGLGKNLQPF